MIFRKLLILTLLLYVFCFSSSAQTAKPATLFKIDSSPIKVYGLKIQGDKITYRLLPSTKAKIYSIAQSQCIKVRYANGKETIFKKPEIVSKPIKTIEKDTLKSSVIVQKPIPKPQRPDRIYIKKSGIIDCKIIEISDKEIKYIVVSDDSQKIRTIKRKNVEKFERNMTVDEKVNFGNNQIKIGETENKIDKTKKTSINNFNPYVDVTLFANGNYMLGSSQWQNPSVGYGHLVGWGSSILAEYYTNPKIAIGLKVGYNSWKTTLNFKETAEGLVYKQHINAVSQIPVVATLRFKLGKHIYLMPEGGISFTTVNSNEIGIEDIFNKVQIGYGLNVGYNSSINNWLSYDLGGFYYHYTAKELELMRYGGVRMGLKISVK